MRRAANVLGSQAGNCQVLIGLAERGDEAVRLRRQRQVQVLRGVRRRGHDDGRLRVGQVACRGEDEGEEEEDDVRSRGHDAKKGESAPVVAQRGKGGWKEMREIAQKPFPDLEGKGAFSVHDDHGCYHPHPSFGNPSRGVYRGRVKIQSCALGREAEEGPPEPALARAATRGWSWPRGRVRWHRRGDTRASVPCPSSLPNEQQFRAISRHLAN